MEPSRFLDHVIDSKLMQWIVLVPIFLYEYKFMMLVVVFRDFKLTNHLTGMF